MTSAAAPAMPDLPPRGLPIRHLPTAAADAAPAPRVPLRRTGPGRLLASQSSTVATGCASAVLTLAVLMNLALDRSPAPAQVWSLRGTLAPAASAPAVLPSDADTIPPPAAAIDRPPSGRDASEQATGLHRVSKTV